MKSRKEILLGSAYNWFRIAVARENAGSGDLATLSLKKACDYELMALGYEPIYFVDTSREGAETTLRKALMEDSVLIQPATEIREVHVG